MAYNELTNSLLHDAREVARSAVHVLNGLSQQRALGVPLDRVLHFGVAAGLFLVAVRFLSRTKAILLVLGVIALKELIDVPAKIAFLQGHVGAPELTADTAWDAIAGLSGLGVGVMLAALLGTKWAARNQTLLRLAPFSEQTALSATTSRMLLTALVVSLTALFLAFQVSGILRGLGPPRWLPHVVTAALVWASSRLFGPANVLLVALPLAQYANWVQRQFASDVLDVSSTVLLALAVRQSAHALYRPTRPLRVARWEWAVSTVAVFCAVVVLFNCFRLGWTPRRMTWLTTPTVGAIACILTGRLLANAKLVRRALMALAAVLAATCVIGAIEFLSMPLRLEDTPGVVYFDAPGLGAYLSYTWPFVFGIALIGGVRPRWLFWIVSLVAVPMIAIVFVRSCWVACMAAGTLAVIFALVRRDWALGTAALLASGLAAAFLFATLRQTQQTAELKSKPGREFVSIFAPGGYQHARRDVLGRANEIIRAHPWVGQTGLETHTLYQTLAINYGIPGAVLLMGTLVGLCAANLVHAKLSGRRLCYAAAAGALAALAGAILMGIGWSPFSKAPEQLFGWYMLGLAVAARLVFAADDDDEPTKTTAKPPNEVPVGTRQGTVPRKPGAPGARLPERFVLLAIALAAFGTAALLLWLMFR